MERTIRILIIIVLLAAFLVPGLVPKARADCDMWSWITTQAGSLDSVGQEAYKESVQWYRWTSIGDGENDLRCDDGWSVFGSTTETDSLAYRVRGDSSNTYPQVYHYWWDNQGSGLDYGWAPYIPPGSASACHPKFIMSHSRAVSSITIYPYPDPHPFVYDLGGRTLAMQHNGSLYSWSTKMQNLVGPKYRYMDTFYNRTYNGYHSPDPNIDSEWYGMLLMKNVLLADNYGESYDDVWAISRTIAQIHDSLTYSALNIYFKTNDEIYAARKTAADSLTMYDHRMWKAYNNPSLDSILYATIVTGNYQPGYDSTNWTRCWYNATAYEIDQGDWLKINRNLTSLDSGALGTGTAPTVDEYAYNGRNPMTGKNVNLSAGVDSDYVAVYVNNGNIFYNYLDQMGLCERKPVQINTNDANKSYNSPDVACNLNTNQVSADYNCFWVTYTVGPAGGAATKVYLVKMNTNGLHYWSTGTPALMNSDTTKEVDLPKVAYGDDRVVVTWQQKTGPSSAWEVHTAGQWSGGSMGDLKVGSGADSTEQKHPDVAYVGTNDNGDKIFVIAYLHKDLHTGSTSHGVCVSQIITSSGSNFSGHRAIQTPYDPDNVYPAITQDDSDHLAVAFKGKKGNGTYYVVAIQNRSPLTNPEPADWWLPVDTTEQSTTTPGSPPGGFFEVSIDNRAGAAGAVDVAYTDYDNGATEDQIKDFKVNFGGNDTVERIDDAAATTESDPAIAVTTWPANQTPRFRRLLLWNGDFTGTAKMIAWFDPWQFGTDGSYASGQPELVTPVAKPVSGYRLNPAYPNPFNPTTILSFTLPQLTQVRLEVFDIQGRLVQTLVDGWRAAGVQSVSFNGSRLASGIYLVRLQAGSYSATQKVVLIK